jgi:hypothetical protein
MPDSAPKSIHPFALLVLAGVAGLSSVLYLLVFVYPYNIFELYPYPRLAVYRFAQDNPVVIWQLAAAWVALVGLFWLGWRIAHYVDGKSAWIVKSTHLLILHSGSWDNSPESESG